MALWPQIAAILGKEFTLELRNRYSINGILLYVVSTVFVCYLSFQKVLTVPVWNALFWVIMLFASVNAVSKSFLTEHRERMLYYHTLFSPQAFVLAKLIYNECDEEISALKKENIIKLANIKHAIREVLQKQGLDLL